MSRIGKIPVSLPKDITFQVNGTEFIVKNSKNKLVQTFNTELISFEQKDNLVSVLRKNDSKEAKSLHGLYRKLLSNMVEGLVKGFTKSLIINGIGYRSELKGKSLLLTLGYSTQFEYLIPDGITIETESPTRIHIKGIDKVLVGQVAAEVRSIRPVEPYKGKGIRYSDEVVKLKEGKSGVKK